MTTFKRFVCGATPCLSGRSGLRLAAAFGLVLTLGFWTGCTRTEEVPVGEVKAVEAYGVRLDENASPEQVVFVLLRSIADDMKYSAEHNHDAQKQAVRTTYSIAAYSAMEQKLLEVMNAPRVQKQTSLGPSRDADLFGVVKLWAPIAGYYVKSFDTDFAAAAQKMRVPHVAADARTVHVQYDVCHKPAETDPARRHAATLDIELARESAGGKAFWRVARVSYAGSGEKPHPATRPSTAPA